MRISDWSSDVCSSDLQAEADVRLARAEKRPDWSVSAGYSRRGPNYADMVSVGVSIDLPLFAKHRQDPIITARAAPATRERLEPDTTARAGRRPPAAATADPRATPSPHHRAPHRPSPHPPTPP